MAGDIPAEKPEAKAKDSNWMVDNVVHPFVNSLAIEPWNALASVTKFLPEYDMLPVSENASGLASLTQSVSGGVGAIIPYIVAGKVTGEAMKGGGRALESASLINSGGVLAKGLASDRLAMVAGAGIYGGAQKPLDGQSRLGNAAGSMVGFGAFELGNKFMPETSSVFSLQGMRNRAIVGAIGGSAGSMAGNYFTTGNVGTFESIAKGGVSGGALNLLLPFGQEKIGKGVDAAKTTFGIPLPVRNFAAREGWSQDATLDDQLNRSPLSVAKRVQGNDSSINQKKNVISMGQEAGKSVLGHEVEHRAQVQQDEPAYKDAATYNDASKPWLYNPDVARQKFIDIRVGQEQRSNAVENRIAGNQSKPLDAETILSSKANANQTYAEKFGAEADQFIKDSKYRPTADNSGTYIDAATGLLTQDINPPEITKWGPVGKYATGPGLQVFTVMDRATAELDPQTGRMLQPAEMKNVEVTAQPQPTEWGNVQVTDKYPDGGVAVHVIQGKADMFGPGDDFPSNVIYTTYRGSPDGLGDSPFGKVTESYNYPADRTEEPRGYTEYEKADGTMAFTFDPPAEAWFGKYIAEDNQTDKIVYYPKDGGVAETYPDGVTTNLGRPDGSTLPLNVDTIVSRPDGSLTYALKNGAGKVDIASDGNKFNATVYDGAEKELEKFAPKSVIENYPAGREVTIGNTKLLNVNQIEHNIHSTTYRSPNSSTQVFGEKYLLQTDWGGARREDFLSNGFKKYFYDNGMEVLTNPQGISEKSGVGPFSRYGQPDNLVQTQITLPDSTVRYVRQNGTSVQEYPSDINAIVGPPVSDLFGGNERVSIGSSEQVPGGLVLRPLDPAAPWSSLHLDFANGQATTYDAEGNIEGTRVIPANFTLIRQFPPANYPDGVISQIGPLRQIETDAQGNDKLIATRPTDGFSSGWSPPSARPTPTPDAPATQVPQGAPEAPPVDGSSSEAQSTAQYHNTQVFDPVTGSYSSSIAQYSGGLRDSTVLDYYLDRTTGGRVSERQQSSELNDYGPGRHGSYQRGFNPAGTAGSLADVVAGRTFPDSGVDQYLLNLDSRSRDERGF